MQDRAQTRRYPVQKTKFPPPAPIHSRIGEKPLGTQSERSISLSTQCQCLSDGTTGDILVSERILLLRTVQIFKRIDRPFGCIDSGRAVRSRPTVKDEVFRRETNPVTACQPYPEIEVFPYLHPFRKPPSLLKNATRNDRCRGLANIGNASPPGKSRERFPPVPDVRWSISGRRSRCRTQPHRHRNRDTVLSGMPSFRDNRAASGRRHRERQYTRSVPEPPPGYGPPKPRILLGHETYQRRCITAYNRSTAVGRTVVHNDYFTGQPALSQHRVERRTHFALLVVKRYDDREFNVHRRIFPAAAHRKYR